MIASLRRAHLRIVSGLALALPVAYAAALAAPGSRPPEPETAALPSTIAAALPSSPSVPDAAGTRLTGLPVTARLERGTAGARVRLREFEPLDRPDLLVYWSPEGPPADPAHPRAGGTLLGRLGDTGDGRLDLVLDLPRGASGTLHLYSLGHEELVASLDLVALSARQEGER